VTTIPVLGERAAGPWFRVLSITASEHPGAAEHDFVSVLPAVLSAARRGRAFAAGWLCRGTGSPLELITNAGPADPGPAAAPGGQPAPARALLYPPGSRGVPAGGDWLAAWDRLVWVLCPARQAPPLAGAHTPVTERGLRRPTLFEAALASQMGRPFGWLVVAEPTDLLDAEIAELRTEVNVLRRQDEERSRFSAERTERRLAELDAFREAGLWQVRVLAGAATPAEVALLAPVLVGSVDVSRHPYRLVSARAAQRLAGALEAKTADPDTGAQAPFPATAGVLAALTGLPRLEVPGLRVIDAAPFDLTSETGDGGREAAAADGRPGGAGKPGGAGGAGGLPATAVSLGQILDRLDRPVGEFRVPLATLNRHAFVTGATGAGKSQTVRHLLEQLSSAGVPWLAIEPVKSEYAAIAGRLGGQGGFGSLSQPKPSTSGAAGDGGGLVTVINPADPAAIPVSVNPLAPEPGYPVQAHIDMLRALFTAAFDADEPFPQIMAQALERVYGENGWDVVTGGGVPWAAADPAVPTLAQLQRAALAVIEDVGYGAQLQADVRGFVDVRLRSLRVGSAGRFFEGGHPAGIGGLLGRNVVLALEDVANDEDKAFLMGTLIIRIVEHLRLQARAGQRGGLRHVIVIEEAHRLLRAARAGRASAHAVELFASMLAEIRAYGEGLVIAEQIPAKLIGDVVKNTALKVVHRLPAGDDRDLVGAAMNLDPDQSRQVVSLAPGVAAVFTDGMDRPVRVQVPFGGGRERALPGPPPPLAGRRSGACGPVCTSERGCTVLELRRAELLAAPGTPEDAWLRLWAETLVLAFVTNRGLPAVPPPVRRRWPGLDRRVRECLLATVIDRAVRARARAVRVSCEPQALAATAASAAVRMLDQGWGAGDQPGPAWVIPQVRWLHEMERVCPLDGGPPGPADRAPPLDFGLPGMADWPDMRVGHRLRALRRHPLSMDLTRNQLPAWTVLLGDDDQRAFTEDLATVGVGRDPGTWLRRVAAMMDAGAWLDVVLSWPRRFVTGDGARAAGLDGPRAGAG
jgi:hypothetical protein